MMVRRAFLALLLICLGCSAQSPPASTAPALPPDVNKVIERQIRSHYALQPDVRVMIGPLHSSEFPNYDALTIAFLRPGKKQEFEFLLSHDRKSLVRFTKLDLTTDPFADTMKKIDLSGRPTRGNKDAKVTVVNYDDFECPFCSRLHSTIFPELFKEYSDRVVFIYKDYPLEEIHPWSVHAAIDANCLAAQNGDAYWDYADYLHANQRLLNNQNRDGQNVSLDKLASLQAEAHKLDVPRLQACVKAQDDKAVRISMREAENLGVDATPAMFVNGQKLDGAVPAEEVRAALDQALKDAGVAPPDHKAAEPPKTPSPAPAK